MEKQILIENDQLIERTTTESQVNLSRFKMEFDHAAAILERMPVDELSQIIETVKPILAGEGAAALKQKFADNGVVAAFQSLRQSIAAMDARMDAIQADVLLVEVTPEP